MNFSDSEKISAVLDSYWLEEVLNDKEADLVIFNTCSIKQKSEDKIFGFLNNFKKIKEKFPHRKYWITWCMVKKTWTRDVNKNKEENEKLKFYSNDELLRRSSTLDFVFRILDLPQVPEILWLHETKEEKTSEDKEKFFQIKQKLKSAHQAIIPIQTGCDNFCTYCVVPYTRWKEHSRSIQEITREVEFYSRKWVKEIILVGQNVNSYWKWWWITKRKFNEENKTWITSWNWDDKTPFSFLLEEINKINWIERIRFQSSNPHDMTDDIIETILNCEKVMPALHFALQSWNDEILAKMRRRHTHESFKNTVEKLRSSEKYWKKFWISTDLIVWFSWETEEQFQDTLKSIQENQFDMIYISQYSVRKWTHAWDNFPDDVSLDIKKRRWQEANEELKKSMQNRMDFFKWQKVKVLIDKINTSNNWEECEWKTEENYVCRFPNKSYKIWEIIEVEVIWNDTWALKAE
jgi:tRNA-2-methylthio-N6-dimethylallyladenosine synthase